MLILCHVSSTGSAYIQNGVKFRLAMLSMMVELVILHPYHHFLINVTFYFALFIMSYQICGLIIRWKLYEGQFNIDELPRLCTKYFALEENDGTPSYACMQHQ